MERLVPLVMDAAGSSNGQLADGIFSLTSADAGRGAGTASHSKSTSSSGSGVFGRRNHSLDSTGAALTASDPISAKTLLAKIGRRGGASGCESARWKVGLDSSSSLMSMSEGVRLRILSRDRKTTSRNSNH